jgi:methionyl-tRNA formyltransferase
VRIAVAATPVEAIPTLEWLLASEHELAFVITQPDKPAGRGKSLRATQVARWAENHSIKVLKPVDVNALIGVLREIDLLLTIGFGVILPESVLSAPRNGSINLHFSLLPAWRGAAPVQRAVERGDTEGGVTVFALDTGMDTGPIYVQHRVPFSGRENSRDILTELSQVGVEAVKEALVLIENERSPTAQSSQGISYAKKITKADARIDWRSSAIEIDRTVRAFTPAPGAWTQWRGQPIQISRLQITRDLFHLSPGEIRFEDGKVIVGCTGEKMVELFELTPAGKKSMNARSWANGARIAAGDYFV